MSFEILYMHVGNNLGPKSALKWANSPKRVQFWGEACWGQYGTKVTAQTVQTIERRRNGRHYYQGPGAANSVRLRWIHLSIADIGHMGGGLLIYQENQEHLENLENKENKESQENRGRQ